MKNIIKQIREGLMLGIAIFGIGYCSKLCEPSEEEKKLDCSTEIGEVTLLNQEPSVFEGNILFNVYETGRKRDILFFDKGFDGTLDEVIVKNNYQRQIYTNSSDLIKWTNNFEKVRSSYARRFS
jgi:hypothetical protein